ncbi:MAG: DUF4349 domain-containing protein [Acidobacteria bacterium]|nr:DUF4349 domain-containing protein [Acidobacteriota bacterium]MBS1866389.1 DUF4349 domain-containing protein [Acidobacteriota bacterium]
MNRIIQSLSRFQSLSPATRKIAVAGTAVAALFLLTVLTAQKHGLARFPRTGSPSIIPVDAPAMDGALPEGDGGVALKEQALAATRAIPQPQAYSNNDFRQEPRVAYSADLGVITKDFIHARSSMEEILDRHRGYAARLRMVGHPDGSSLSANLKVPASEYSSTLVDLKSIGDVQTDDESADEVIQQHGDLEARLQNARNNARRLEQLLKENSAKSIDVDYVQRQLIILRAEIAKLELERHNVDERVVFSNIHFSLREVRETPAQTVSAQLRNAAASGLTDVIGSLSALLIFLVGYGPSFLLWAAILFFPARYLWRRSRVSFARESA